MERVMEYECGTKLTIAEDNEIICKHKKDVWSFVGFPTFKDAYNFALFGDIEDGDEFVRMTKPTYNIYLKTATGERLCK